MTFFSSRSVSRPSRKCVSPVKARGRIALFGALVVSMTVISSSASPSVSHALNSNGLTYTAINDTAWELSGCDGSCDANIVIPSVVDGKPVTSIASWSFYGKATIVTVEIPASVTSIGSYAFVASTSLTTFTTPASDHFKIVDGMLLTKDGTELVAYPSGDSTSAVNIPGGVKIMRSGSVGSNPITQMSLPASLEVIGDNVIRDLLQISEFIVAEGNTTFKAPAGVLFNQSTLMMYPRAKSGTEYSIPESTTAIATEAFRGVSNLTSLELPSSLSTIVDKSFDGLSNLELITVVSGNTTLEAIDGVLYGSDTLFKYPPKRVGTTYSVRPGTTEIGFAAFDSAEFLTEVILPASVRVIKWDAFARMSGLTSINLPLGLTTLGSYSLHATGLTSVVIPHTVTNWNDNIFAYSKFYESVYFEGDAPPASVLDVINYGDKIAKIYRIVGTNGWEAIGDRHGGLEQVAWDPDITTPRAPSVTALAQSVRVTANRGSGGLPTSYLVTASPGEESCTIATGETSCVVPDLTGGTPYTFTTKATKGDTTTASSLASTAVTPLSSQTISFADPADREFSTTPFTVTATSNSNLPVSLTSTTQDVCTVSGFNVSMLTPGTCTLTASQAGDTAYTAATDIDQSFAILAAETPPAETPPAQTPPAVTPPAETPPAAAIVTTTPVVSAVGTSVAIAREPSSIVATAVAIGVSKTKVMVALKVPKASKPANQVTKYVIQLKSAKGVIITKTISVKAGRTVKPTLTGKKKTSYSMTVTAVTKSGKKTTWKGPKVKTS
jgi:hypothetical protein